MTSMQLVFESAEIPTKLAMFIVTKSNNKLINQ